MDGAHSDACVTVSKSRLHPLSGCAVGSPAWRRRAGSLACVLSLCLSPRLSVGLSYSSVSLACSSLPRIFRSFLVRNTTTWCATRSPGAKHYHLVRNTTTTQGSFLVLCSRQLCGTQTESRPAYSYPFRRPPRRWFVLSHIPFGDHLVGGLYCPISLSETTSSVVCTVPYPFRRPTHRWCVLQSYAAVDSVRFEFGNTVAGDLVQLVQQAFAAPMR
jgi:hypothetical protein